MLNRHLDERLTSDREDLKVPCCYSWEELMSPKFDGPVYIPMVVSVLHNSPSNGACHENKPTEKEPALPAAWRKRVFVQTERGHVFDMELDRRDNANSVKKRLQLALNIPTDESSLTIGDRVLNNDLGAVRKDCPLLLTRNMLHRSSSTPCLSPTEREAQYKDESGVIEILGHSSCFSRTTELVNEIMRAIKNGVDPIPVNGGLGGVYYFKNSKGENVAIVKPTDEEPFAPNNPKGLVGKALGQPGLKWSVRVGETGYREVAAYLLDYDHFALVPPTALVKISHSVFNVNDSVNGSKLLNFERVSKIASLQQFIPHDFDASDHGTSDFPVTSVHRIGILDVRIFNTDRHAGNILVRKHDTVGQFGRVELFPIDHGLCLPEGLEDPYFEWIHWPQASIPFSAEEIEYIEKLDPFRDCEMLRDELPMIREASLRMLILCTMFLKEAAAFGLCLAEIGEMMTREFHCHQEEPSELEMLCLKAKEFIAMGAVPTDESFQFDVEDQVTETGIFLEDFSGQVSPHSVSKFANSSSGVSEHEYGAEEDGTVSNILKTGSREREGMPKLAFLDGPSYAERRRAEELLPLTTGFVKLEDLSEKEWKLFLCRFQELLGPTFVQLKFSRFGVKKTRLGASCEF